MAAVIPLPGDLHNDPPISTDFAGLESLPPFWPHVTPLHPALIGISIGYMMISNRLNQPYKHPYLVVLASRLVTRSLSLKAVPISRPLAPRATHRLHVT